jgi:hypothetical protein
VKIGLGSSKFGMQSSIMNLGLVPSFWSPVPNCEFEAMAFLMILACIGYMPSIWCIFCLQAYYILDEVLIAGELQESSKKSVARVIAAQDTLIDNAKEQASSLSNMIAQATK